ncbi:hypothetical protein GF325_16165 [Candidatus Bathyarchaeota archaeon]|nr:hypothetical protein [Candidatus Bathyarchaeota archaeon]
MGITLDQVVKVPECMDCEKYSSGCDHLNAFIADLRGFLQGYRAGHELEISIKITCKDGKLCS